MISFFFFFFQAEDGIRDDLVTGVQTCALPIWHRDGWACWERHRSDCARSILEPSRRTARGDCEASRRSQASGGRSGERRVGEKGRSRWAPDHLKKKKKKTRSDRKQNKKSEDSI